MSYILTTLRNILSDEVAMIICMFLHFIIIVIAKFVLLVISILMFVINTVIKPVIYSYTVQRPFLGEPFLI